MNTKRFALAAVAYVVLVMTIATVWHLGLFKDVYAVARMREHPLFHLGFASMIIQALILAYAYPRVSLAGAPIARGLKFGLLSGVLLGSYGVLAEAGKYDVGPVSTFLVCESAFFIVQYSVVGIAIGLIYGEQTT
jgi:hypothetical protein